MLNVFDIRDARKRSAQRADATLCMRCGCLPATRRTDYSYVWVPRAGGVVLLAGLFGLILAYVTASRHVYTVYSCHGCDRRVRVRHDGKIALVALTVLQAAALAAIFSGVPAWVTMVLALGTVAATQRAAAAPANIHVTRLSGGHVILTLDPDSRHCQQDGPRGALAVFFPHLTRRTRPLTVCQTCGCKNDTMRACSRCHQLLDARATVWRPAA